MSRGQKPSTNGVTRAGEWYMKIVNITFALILLAGFLFGCADVSVMEEENCAAEIAAGIELESMKP